MRTILNRAHSGQTLERPIYPIHKTHRKKDEVVQKKDERRLTDGILDFRMQTIQEFAMAAKPWFELIKEGKPLTEPVPSSLTEPLRSWLGALCDSPQVLYHARGDLGSAEINFRAYGLGVMRAMEKTPEERKAAGAGSAREPNSEDIELVKSVIFTINCQRCLYRLNALEDKISKQPYNELHPQDPAPKSAELIYFISGALRQHAMLLDGAERRALSNWLKRAEKLLGDIYAYGDERARVSVHATRMRKQLVVH